MRNLRGRATVIALLLLIPVAMPAAQTTAAPGCIGAPHSNVGCDFYAVTLPTFVDQTTFSFGVDVLNTSGASIDVTVTGGSLGSSDMFSVTAGSSVTHVLPWVSALSTSTATVVISGGAYHITTNGPVSALQLNPTTYVDLLGPTYSYTNDASLLLPVQSAGTAFRAIAWPTENLGPEYPGDVAVVATANGTTVQVTAPGTIEPGAGLDANGGSVMLDAGDILLISSALSDGSSLGGALITSSAPVLAWSGHYLAQVPDGTSYADHLEEALQPVSALGDDYLVVRPGNPDPAGSASAARQYVALVGTVDNTTVSTDPAIPGLITTLNAGQLYNFEATVDFHLQTSQPVAVGVFMEGAQTIGFNGYGDPAESIAIPTNQARRSFDFVAAPAFNPFAEVVAPTDASITVDGSAVTGWTAIGSSGYSVASVALCCTDAHHARGNQSFTLSVYSYPAYTSYWYPAGLGLDEIFGDSFE